MILVLLSVYLQSNPDPLGERPLGKNCLNLWYNSAAEDASFRTNQITVLLDAWHHCKVLWEISGDDTANAFPLQLFRSFQFWRRWDRKDVIRPLSFDTAVASASIGDWPSSMPLSIWLSSSWVCSQWCSFQLSPVSLLRITSSRSFPRRAAKWGISTMTGLEEQDTLGKSK